MKGNQNQIKKIERVMLEKDQVEDSEINGDIVAFNKESLFKPLPIESKGETGSGKSTKLPQYLFQAGYCENSKMIALTLPKRVSVINIANRLAFNLSCQLGQEVGYSIRFDSNYSSQTKIKVLTDGMLVREMLLDPLLSQYSVIMVDDCHERSLYTDIILGLLKKIRRKRQDLKIIISSATIEASLFNRFFNEPPDFKSQIVEVEGRMYPVEIFYLERPCKNYISQAVDTAYSIHAREELNTGDILVFLTGQEEINKFIEDFNLIAAEKKIHNSVYCLPCYANLPIDKQVKIFEPTPINKSIICCIQYILGKIIVSTNIAETSITIENIVFVIDCCFVKVKYYDPHTNLESLVVIPASKSSCDQRAGRSGRVKPGKCFRLCIKTDYDQLPLQMKPEIQRSDTSYLILQLKALGIKNLLNFDYISPPSKENFIRSLEVLYSLGALDEQAQLTQDIGMKLVEMPVDPKMAAYRDEWKVTDNILTIAALMSVQNLFQSVKDPTIISKNKKKYGCIEGDHITLLNIFNLYMNKKSENEKKGLCRELHLNEKSIKRAIQIRAQLKLYLKQLGVKIKKSDDYDDPEAILKSLITGFFANVAQRQIDGTYKNVRSSDELVIHPSSVLANIKPKWILYNEIVVTSKKYMREVSAIEVQWLIELAPHFYVDKRKQILEEQHKREAIRNIEHDLIKEGKKKDHDYIGGISGQLNKQNLRFRNGINLSNIQEETSTSTIQQPVFKRFKAQQGQEIQKSVQEQKTTKSKDKLIGLSFEDEDY